LPSRLSPSLRQEVQPALKYLEVPPRLYEELYKAKQDAREKERTRLNADRLRRQQTGRGSLIEFVRYFWHTPEPQSRKLVEGWPLEAICLHLEAVTFGDIKRLLINVPPGFMKSLLTDVFWPAWEWGPMNMPHMRYVAFSYSDGITTRDNNKMVRLINSAAFQELWGDRFTMIKLGETKIENDQTGFKLATSTGGSMKTMSPAISWFARPTTATS
jgi:hypothetical protein